MALDPKPIRLTQIDEEDFAGAFDPQPFVVVGPMPEADAGPDIAWHRVNNLPLKDGNGVIFIEALGANGIGAVSGRLTIEYSEPQTLPVGKVVIVRLIGSPLTSIVAGHPTRGNNTKPAQIIVTLPNNAVEWHFGSVNFNWAFAGQEDTLYFRVPSSATFTQFKQLEVEF